MNNSACFRLFFATQLHRTKCAPSKEGGREGSGAGKERGRQVPLPSTGSTIHVGASVRAAIDPASALDSSPMSWSSGKLLLTASKISFSFALSVSVTLVFNVERHHTTSRRTVGRWTSQNKREHMMRSLALIRGEEVEEEKRKEEGTEQARREPNPQRRISAHSHWRLVDVRTAITYTLYHVTSGPNGLGLHGLLFTLTGRWPPCGQCPPS